MNGFWGGVIRWLVVIVMGIATFYPDYGLLWLGLRNFPAAPLPISITGLLWLIAMCLMLPLPLLVFRVVSTGAIIIMAVMALYLLGSRYPALINFWPAYMWAVVVAFIAFGWLAVSTRLWRWASGIVATQQTAEHHSNN